MRDSDIAQTRYLDEIAELKRQIAELKSAKSQLQQSEEALRRSEEKYRDIFDNAPVGIFQSTPAGGRYLTANREFAHNLGFDSAEELIRTVKNIPELYVDPRAREKMKQHLCEHGWLANYELHVKNRKTGTAWMSVHIRVVRDETGEIAYFEGFTIDITRRKQAEEEKKKLEAQFLEAQKMEAVGTLAGGIAHDFNNLLMGIQGRISLMAIDTEPSHPFYEHFRSIEEYVKDAANLTRQLLGFARGGKYEVKPTDLNEVVRKSVDMFGRTRKEIAIHTKYQENIWSVEADLGQIQQVLLNLYVNAWQAMPDGGHLYIETSNLNLDHKDVNLYHAKAGRFVKISVTDTGIGIDEAIRQRIFDPFFTTKERERGTGLGLASVYGIVKNHGGFINVYSEKGKGATFNLYFPASEKQVAKKNLIPENAMAGTETILLVDDEHIVIEVAKNLLERLGYRVLTSTSGKAGIEAYLAKKDQIDAVILDMIMPDMSGAKVYTKLCEINPDVKVLISSGYSLNDQARELLHRGCMGFIQKPCSIKELSTKLRETLDKDR